MNLFYIQLPCLLSFFLLHFIFSPKKYSCQYEQVHIKCQCYHNNENQGKSYPSSTSSWQDKVFIWAVNRLAEGFADFVLKLPNYSVKGIAAVKYFGVTLVAGLSFDFLCNYSISAYYGLRNTA